MCVGATGASCHTYSSEQLYIWISLPNIPLSHIYEKPLNSTLLSKKSTDVIKYTCVTLHGGKLSQTNLPINNMICSHKNTSAIVTTTLNSCVNESWCDLTFHLYIQRPLHKHEKYCVTFCRLSRGFLKSHWSKFPNQITQTTTYHLGIKAQSQQPTAECTLTEIKHEM